MFFGGPIGKAAQTSSFPEASQLLESSLKEPQISYTGHVMITQWFGTRTFAEEAKVFHAPHNKYHWEFVSPSGHVKRVVVSDGAHEYVWLTKQNQILTGNAPKSGAKLMIPEKERELLLKNYRVSASQGETVAGRATWELKLSPVVEGKPHQLMWIDQKTDVILQIKLIGPAGSRVAVSRFTQFEPQSKLPKDTFELHLSSMVQTDEHGLDPEFLSLEDLNRSAGKRFAFPAELPGNFVYESGDAFDVEGSTVCHLRYTDGLAVLSLFETTRPVRVSGTQKKEFSLHPLIPGQFTSGKVLQWKGKRQYFTLVGDVSDELLQQIERELKRHASSPSRVAHFFH